MRVGIVLAATVLVGACASIVNLDKADDPAQSGATKAPAAGDDKGASDAGKSTSSSSGSSSGSGGTSSGAPTPNDAGADTGTKPADGTCTKNEDCPQEDDDHDRCSNTGKCTKTCVKESTPCLVNAPDLPCCFGLVCKKAPAGSLDICQTP